MVKRKSRENARDRKCSADLSDDGKPLCKKPKPGDSDSDTTWVDDDTLQNESPAVEQQPPIYLNIHIHEAAPNVESEEEEEEESDEEFQELRRGRSSGIFTETRSKVKSKKKQNEVPLKLTRQEETYYNSLPKAQKKDMLDVMKRISTLVLDDGVVPYKFKILSLPISDYTKSTVIKKVMALSEMPSDSGESYKLKTWVDGFLRIPFGKTIPLPVKLEDGTAKCTEFITTARKNMNKSVYGMVPAKTQILQTISQWIVNPDSVGNVIALQGPMGVGKTSFARNAIAEVLQRPFEFFSLGGASDISNFTGHSYTYEGSMWGRIADCLMHSGAMNPVLYFDELDKVSTTPHGEEIVSMLIHLTDRSQNTQFHDRYFSGIDFDVSQCLFVFSFNDIDKVHPILRDRMNVINCAGYNETDKRVILKEHIWPQIVKRLKFKEDDVILDDSAITLLILDHSVDEKGVRHLIRTVETMMTRLNMLRVADDESMKEYCFYMKVKFPLTIDRNVAQVLLTDIDKKEKEIWRSLYT
jgi:ATP-dependent Lon protease